MFYEDDRFNPRNESEDVLDKKALNDIKSMDKGYFKLKKKIQRDEQFKNVNIELYASGDTGSHIRHAITGHRFPFLVGSKEEDMFFKIGMSTGVTKNAGSFFYESPEQFETHQYVTLPLQSKQRWHEKRLATQRV